MFIKTVEIMDNHKSIRLDYEQSSKKSRTLRERFVFISRNLTLTHVISCIDIKIKELDDYKILATLSNGVIVNLIELYNINIVLDSLNIKNSIGSLEYGDSTVFIDKSGIRIITHPEKKGGYIGHSKHCLNIPWFLNLKSRLYVDDHKEWLTT